MLNLIRAEWFKLTRRPMTWVLLVVFVGLLVVLRATEFFAVALSDGTFSGGEIRMSLLREEQVEQFRRQLTFPGIFGAVLGHVNSIGGICAIVLAAGAIGSEYGWGTLRTQLARQPNRGRYLVTKVATLLLVLMAAIVIDLAIGALLALVFGGLLSGGSAASPSAGSADVLLALPIGALRALYVMLPYVMLTVACGILGRSVLAAAAGGFFFLILDVGLGALAFLGDLGGPIAFLVSLVVQPNVNTLVVLNSRAFGLDPAILSRNMDLAALPSSLHATLVIGAWSALFFAYAYRALIGRDITGAS
jgi:ABC-type transport system involved in multi-copper enzyme maturation permease subunit